MRICVTTAKVILAHTQKPRRSKYERANFLRIDISKVGKVTFYAEFPKVMELKGKKLGEWPLCSTFTGSKTDYLFSTIGIKMRVKRFFIPIYFFV